MASALFGRATWSNSPTVNNVTLPAEFMLKFSIDESEKYASWRTSPYKWLVVRSVDHDVKSALILSLHRVYTVITQDFDNSVWLMCDYNFFECNDGMVCPHMVHVKKFYASNPIISHHNISVRWWKSYIYFSMKNESDCSSTEKEIWKKLQALCQNDCKGPNFIAKDDDHTFFRSIVFTSLERNRMINSRTQRNAPLSPFFENLTHATVSSITQGLRSTLPSRSRRKAFRYLCRKRYTFQTNQLPTSMRMWKMQQRMIVM